MFRLALALGKSVAEVNSWPVHELRSWAAFERLHPFPSARSDVQTALVAQAACSAWGNPPPLKAFIPDYAAAALPPESPLEAARRKEQELLSALHRDHEHPGRG